MHLFKNMSEKLVFTLVSLVNFVQNYSILGHILISKLLAIVGIVLFIDWMPVLSPNSINMMWYDEKL